jgi:hypothetical protein
VEKTVENLGIYRITRAPGRFCAGCRGGEDEKARQIGTVEPSENPQAVILRDLGGETAPKPIF